MYQDRRLTKVNPVAKKVSQVVMGFGLLFATALAFQNCSGYQMYDTVNAEELASTCGSECNLNLAGVTFKVTNSTISVPEASLAATDRVIDIGGYCDDAEFPLSKLKYQWLDGSTLIDGGWKDSTASCNELGRFHMRATVPAVTSFPVSNKRFYTLSIGFAVSSGSGTFQDSPAGTKSISIEIVK